MPLDLTLSALDVWQFVVAGVCSLIGLAAFIYGRRQARFGWLLGGIALMTYPFFVPSVLLLIVIGCAIIAAMWLFPG